MADSPMFNSANRLLPRGRQKLSGRFQDDGNAAAVVTNYAPERYINLASYQAEQGADPVPIVVSVQTIFGQVPTTSLPAPYEQAYVVSPDGWADAQLQGNLRIRYGNETISERLIDIRSGSYQLPPVSFVRVDCQVYYPLGFFNGQPANISVELIGGLTDSPAEWLYSGTKNFAAGAQLGILRAPMGGRFWRFAREDTTVGAPNVADAQIWAFRGVQPQYYVDYNTLPPLISPPVPDLAVTVNTALVDKTGADTLNLSAQCIVSP